MNTTLLVLSIGSIILVILTILGVYSDIKSFILMRRIEARDRRLINSYLIESNKYKKFKFGQ